MKIRKKAEDERNCETCGYPTRRERAITVYNGLFPEDMCIIYMDGIR